MVRVIIFYFLSIFLGVILHQSFSAYRAAIEQNMLGIFIENMLGIFIQSGHNTRAKRGQVFFQTFELIVSRS